MEENTNNNDRSKVIMLVSLIIVVSLLIVGFVFIAVIDLTHKDAESKLKTTTRRTVLTEKTEKIDNPFLEDDEEEETIEPTTETTTTQTTKSITVAKTTKRMTTTSVNNEEYTETVIPSNTYEIATGPSNYPDSLDAWEWEIISLINAERRKNGLNELAVAKELRDKAEEGAYLYYSQGADALKPYLSGHSYLYMYSNLDINASTLYTNTINSTKVTENPDLKYVGAGVIVKKTSLDTYFYVIIYE